MDKVVVLLLLVLVLAGCSRPARGATATPADGSVMGNTPAVVQTTVGNTGTMDAGTVHTATITVDPTSGYAGTFMDVSGAGWPPSAMVLVKLEDEHGPSPVLAAIAADAQGQFTTGFVYPVGERWLQPGPQLVLAHTEGGQLEATAPFTVVPPEGVTVPTETPTVAAPTATVTPAATVAVTATIPFTSGALAATPVATATPSATATPPATATPAARVAIGAMAMPTAPALQNSQGDYSDAVSTIDELIDAINRMPAGVLDPKLANSLTKKLSNAQKQVSKGHATPAANMLGAFQHEVEAQRGKHIADDAAAFLIVSANNVIAQLQQGQPGGTGDSNSNDNGNDKDKSNGNGQGKGKGNGRSNDGKN